MRRSVRVLLFLFLALAPAIGTVRSPAPVDAAAAQTTATIEVHARVCDEVPVDGNWFGACHDSPASGLLVEARNTATAATVSGTTGPAGNVTLTVDPGTWELLGPPGEFVSATFIFCSTGHNATELPYPVTLAAGDQIVCDDYFVPENLSGMGTIEIHGRICDAVPANGDWFGTCHDSLAVNVMYDATDTATNEVVSGTTGANGNVTLTLPAGTWRLSGPPGDFLKATFIYCSTGENTPQVPHPVTLASGDAVICDYYVVPEPQGPTPTTVPPTAVPTVVPTAVPPTPAPTAAPRQPVLQLPVVILAGTCADVAATDTPVVALSDAVVLQGNADGATDAIQAATSYTRVTIPLSTMLANDHVIAVLSGDGQAIVACGAIGGVADGQGAYTIGLAPVGDSGVAGTAYLAMRDGNATGISVFVVPEGLVPTPPPTPVG